MDLQEYIQVLKRERYFFWITAVGIWLVCFAWFSLQPLRYQGTLLLNVGRTAPTSTTTGPVSPEYTYDNFYRLQADERFADTLVRWLGNPRIVSDVLSTAGTSADLYTERQLRTYFQAKRLSSQVVEVEYSADTKDALYRYAEAMNRVTSRYAETLNGSQENWFRIVGSDPVIREARVGAWPFLAFAALGALFLAFWAVFVKRFLEPSSC
jgi:hypothetical protein